MINIPVFDLIYNCFFEISIHFLRRTASLKMKDTVKKSDFKSRAVFEAIKKEIEAVRKVIPRFFNLLNQLISSLFSNDILIRLIKFFKSEWKKIRQIIERDFLFQCHERR